MPAVRRMLIVLVSAALLAGALSPTGADARPRRVRPPSRATLIKLLKKADSKVYYLSRDGVTDISVKFPKYTKFGCWIQRLMYWKKGDKLYYEIKDLPEKYQPAQRAFVGRLIDEFDGTMYPLVAMPLAEFAEKFDLSAPDPKKLKKIVFTPKADHPTRYIKKVVDLDDKGFCWRITTLWPPPPPTKEELELDPDFKGKERETYTSIGYAKQGRKYFFRRIDLEGRERKVIIDIEKWIRRGKHWVPKELTLVDPFAGNENLAAEDIKLDQDLDDEMFEGFPHRLTR